MIKLKEGFPEVIQNIIETVIVNNLSEHDTLYDMRNKMTEFSDDIILKDLTVFSFYDFNNYEDFHKTEDNLKLIHTCARFKDELYLVLAREKGKIKTIELKRQISPPLEAYKYISHNKTDIKDSGRSYGLLFE